MLLCLSSADVRCFQETKEPPREKSLQASFNLFRATALGAAARDIGFGFRVVRQPREDDLVESAIDVAIAAAIEAVPGDLAR